MRLALVSILLSGTAAFTTPSRPSFATHVAMSDAIAEDVEEIAVYECISKEAILAEPNCIEFASVWDPLGLADYGSEETLAWFRHAEVKHGRVAMAAFVGWWAVGAGLRLPGELSHGLEFSSIPSKGLEAWDTVPGWGKIQLLLFAGLIELHDELFFSARGKHYLRGGTPGKNMVPGLWDPLGISRTKSEKDLARGRSVEIKNGRLAMIGIAGLYAAASIEGSVPFQPPC